MKYLAILFLVIGLSETVYSKCGSGIEVFPSSKSINTEGHIIIQAYGWGRAHELLDLLDSKYRVYLKSINGKTKLNKWDYKKGNKSWSQVLLVPENKLEAGVTYTLVIEKLLPDDQIYLDVNRLYRNGKHTKAYWTVESSGSFDPIVKDLELELKSSDVIKYGCGPAVETCFGVQSGQKDGTILLMEIAEIESGKLSEYYLIIRDNEIRIGHHMCSGPYRFRDGYTYRIRSNTNYLTEIDENARWIDCPNPWSD